MVKAEVPGVEFGQFASSHFGYGRTARGSDQESVAKGGFDTSAQLVDKVEAGYWEEE